MRMTAIMNTVLFSFAGLLDQCPSGYASIVSPPWETLINGLVALKYVILESFSSSLPAGKFPSLTFLSTVHP
jgi:hypothetical protein